MTDSELNEDLLPAASSGLDADNPMAFWMDEDMTARAWKVAQRIASSQLVPANYRNRPEDCLIALEMSLRLRESPIVILQNLNIINGKPSLGAAFSIDKLNKSGLIEDPLIFEEEGEGDDLTVTAVCTRVQDGAVIRVEASMKMAILEGWTKNAKYKSMPVHMLSFRAGSLLIRRHFPSVNFGLPIMDDASGPPSGNRGSGPYRKRGGARPSAAAESLRRTPEVAAEAEVVEEPKPEPEPEPRGVPADEGSMPPIF